MLSEPAVVTAPFDRAVLVAQALIAEVPGVAAPNANRRWPLDVVAVMVLVEHAAMHVADIGHCLGLPRSTNVELINTAVEMGVVERVPHTRRKGDRRGNARTLVRLTAKGMRARLGRRGG